MGRGRRPDPRKRKVAHASSTYLEVPNKTKAGGWKAGEVYGLYCHHVGNTKPCADDVTNGGLECSYCKLGIDQVFRAYLPLWDRDYNLRHVLIGQDVFEAADRIPFRHTMTLSRALASRAPLVVNDEPLFVRLLPDGPPWNAPVDMLTICLTLWNDDPITQWLKLEKLPTAVEKGNEQLKSNGEKFGPMTAAAARRFAPPVKPEEPSSVDDAAREALRKMVASAKPSGNGSHKPKG